MKVTQQITLFKSLLTLFILFAIYGCQTTDSVNETTPSAYNLRSDKAQPDVGEVEHIEKKDVSSKKEASQSKETAALEKEHIEKFQKKFFGMLGGHGGAAQSDTNKAKESETMEQAVDDLTVKHAKTENRPFKDLEKGLYGNWINDLETESYDFHDDGAVEIIVVGQRNKSHTLSGNYILTEKERIKFDFKNDSFARQMPTRYYKISISKNEFSLTDEPQKSGEIDGPTTKYKRIK